ncbi:hypothetical protein DPMN_128930 [Dreissena polymorpha]|uniref:Uncharacterized protein n=1 Tax=Dreissena polymorpha TaxID=45954 RepID=A0A9D4K032_DREPO|nr:hypothetical protein DPMN_128930 [Dreissena polymorpha]
MPRPNSNAGCQQSILIKPHRRADAWLKPWEFHGVHSGASLDTKAYCEGCTDTIAHDSYKVHCRAAGMGHVVGTSGTGYELSVNHSYILFF